jgi:hypothetical protein
MLDINRSSGSCGCEFSVGDDDGLLDMNRSSGRCGCEFSLGDEDGDDVGDNVSHNGLLVQVVVGDRRGKG